ncbi:hypothetical protein FB451DRAFT_1396733 [Mycena latifolia]|nr:hypothetical protein FB451DRAFT_1396733 [Mycena latifolia]
MRELDTVSDNDGTDDEDEDLPPSVPMPPQNSAPARRHTLRSWFPTTLASLFGGVIENPITVARRERVVSEESLYLELLAAEHSEEKPNAGAQEGSGDDYEG